MIGILHPGEMGSAVALTLQNAGNQVCWVSHGRGAGTRQRAAELGLRDAGTLERMCAQCSTIVSVCPPAFADDVAEAVLQHGFCGFFIDANAISPARVERMAQRMARSGVSFVDASIIGLATREPGRVWIYFSGARAAEATALFGKTGPLQPEAIEGPVGRASALKMCYAGYNKGAAALLCATFAAAGRWGVRELLETQWARSDREMAGAAKKAARVAAKAWRFAPEMREIAETFESAGITPAFHRAAEDIYARMEAFKDSAVDVANVMEALADGKAKAHPT